MRKSVVFFLCLLIGIQSFSQRQQDSLKTKHSPKLAATFSAVLPGLGQAYNKKYWKIPIVYAGIGTLAYLSIRNNNYYQDFKTAYKNLYDTNPNGYYYMYNTSFTLSGLEAGKNYYRRYRDMYAIFTVGVYVLNIVDAAVDGYLYDFDISDDLSLKIQPEFMPIAQNNSWGAGVKICLSIQK
ncbi:MAG TPA: DUF5683 domain-containing protein [Bacteroidales bacterium]|nr:DUF5683 domain-containing protein [Bacteroidales bacterium]